MEKDMFGFILGLLLVIVGIVVPIILAKNTKVPKMALHAIRFGVPVVGLLVMFVSTAIYVEDNQAGVVVVKFGSDLPTGQIIATNGEKGPQARVLPPGWHFLYYPWQYDLEAVDNITIPQGHVGVVETSDGANPLPKGEIFAPEWDNPVEMLDAQKFMTTGVKGPQLTVLTPGQYRYNPRLYKITAQKALEVPIGTVAVIKANAGAPFEGEKVTVNGVPIVPKGHRGIWNEALSPNAYYLHPNAYVVTLVQTTNRIYNYIGKNAIGVKTLDSFEFPVDVRVSVKVSAEDAPQVVAMLATPDADPNKDGFNVLEDRVILPLIRAIFRNNAESMGAIQYVQQRTLIESGATLKFSEGLKKFNITTDGVYVGELGIRDTEEGKALLQTQTDKEVAIRQKETYNEKRLAEIERSAMVEAEENANQEKNKAIARAKVDIAEQESQAVIKMAKGEAEAYKQKLEALGGVDNFVKLEMIKMISGDWKPVLPNTLVIGGGEGGMSAVEALMLKSLTEKTKK
jgi:regulator of protease activity HflC (stomatin/prohibitin superfamily)